MIIMGTKLEKSVLVVATVSSFFSIFLSSAVLIAVPSIATEFHMNNIVQNWISTIYFLSIAVITIPAGQISGKYGLKKTMGMGLVLFILSSIAIMFSNSQDMFLICRIFQGIGGGILNVAAMAMVVSAFSPQDRGQAIGITVTGVYLGTSLSPVIGGILNYDLGWRSIFVFTIPFLIICLALLFSKVTKEWVTFEGIGLDWKGSILYGIGILLFIVGFTTLNKPNGLMLTIIGIILLICFIYTEIKVKNPVFDVRFFKNPKFSSSNLAALCAYLATFAIVTIVNYYLQYIKGFNSQNAGFLLMIGPLFQVVLAPLAGRVSDRVNPQKLSALGIGIGAVALGMLASLTADSPLWFLALALALQGIGFGIFSSPNTNAIMSSVPPEDTPIASASVAVMRVVGQTMSLGMLTLIFAFMMGNVPIQPSNYGILLVACKIIAGICTILCIISVFSSLVGIKSKPKFIEK